MKTLIIKIQLIITRTYQTYSTLQSWNLTSELTVWVESVVHLAWQKGECHGRAAFSKFFRM